MYMPRAISDKKKNLVAFSNADSLLSSQVFGVGCLNPLGHTDWVEPPVVKYSVTVAAGFPTLAEDANPRMLDLESACNMRKMFVL